MLEKEGNHHEKMKRRPHETTLRSRSRTKTTFHKCRKWFTRAVCRKSPSAVRSSPLKGVVAHRTPLLPDAFFTAHKLLCEAHVGRGGRAGEAAGMREGKGASDRPTERGRGAIIADTHSLTHALRKPTCHFRSSPLAWISKVAVTAAPRVHFFRTVAL